METNKQGKNSIKMMIADLCICIAAIVFDQLTKVQIRATLPVSSSYDVIPSVLQILHHENPGASWGMMKGQTTLFLIIAVVVVIALSLFVRRIPQEKKYLPLNIAASLILAGAIGHGGVRHVHADLDHGRRNEDLGAALDEGGHLEGLLLGTLLAC